MISSDAVVWQAANDPHPAREASQRSYSAVAKGDLAEWLTVYHDDAVLEDPVGPSMFDPEGRGHRGHAGIAAFWDKAIAPIETFEFTVDDAAYGPGGLLVGVDTSGATRSRRSTTCNGQGPCACSAIASVSRWPTPMA